ncbi:Methyltransferase type 11 [Xylanimonas cellulosilytica DSM 15894]|uniref:Methyltransferase type 11 n=1 Tax=Xylanimonas cellulosilytica (strain DSM 15894 / JCM 12276 / CECT 5975 / KCTC 9989 / LMG 20990 / NBRC 107835 / XIL07) TaxID=446471 RepID=D1BS51_XYLCX|nr:class I SAM-dependent methyltransferase [Xylanimonas cellulosilytica]ACZ30543.1 Methyltransferase type 11 [Xylanimonas cellulosilytica DSM 15894]
MNDIESVGYRHVPDAEGGAAGRTWWDANAGEYLDEHGAFLGDAGFRWGPEGLTEAEAGLLGDVTGRRVLEVGAGAAQCSRWLAGRGAVVVATDVSHGMLRRGAPLDAATGVPVPVVQADARALPFADASFDVVFTSFGAIPFVPDAVRVHAEAARVLRPGGRWVFSVTHPLRWAFPDDPTRHGLTATRSYFDRRPYVEQAGGRVVYAEYHRTVGDHVRDVAAAGLHLLDVVEPEWPAWNDQVWGGWGPERGAYLPGTAIYVTVKPL